MGELSVTCIMEALFALSPLNMSLIALLIALVIVAGVVGWRHSPRTRRLVVFALALIAGLILFVTLASLIQIYLFPLPPL